MAWKADTPSDEKQKTHEYDNLRAGSMGVRSHSSAKWTSSDPSSENATHFREIQGLGSGDLRHPFMVRRRLRGSSRTGVPD
jgi:hypothetical protein